MRQHILPCQKEKTCPQWGYLKAEKNKHNTWDRASDDRDDTCMIVLTNLCVDTKDVYIVKTTQTHKYKPSYSIEQDRKHDKAINMPKTTTVQTRKNEKKTLQELMGWAQVFATIIGEIEEGSKIWMQPKTLEGVPATTTLGDTLVEYQLLNFGSFSA